MQILWPAGSHCHRPQGSQHTTGKASCSWDPRDDNGIIVEQHFGKHVVLEYSRSRGPTGLGLLISANALVASTQYNHIVLPCTIASKETLFNTFAMADCGATASFIDSLFTQLHGLKFISMQHPCDFTVADGRIISSGAITHIVRIALALGRTHCEVLELYITRLGQYPVVLGLSWLQKHDPRIRFKENTVTFDSKYCLDHCITTSTHQAMTIWGADNTFDTLHESHKIYETIPKTHKTLQKTYETPQTHETHETRRSTSKPRYSPRSSHSIDMADCTRKMNQELTLLENLNNNDIDTAGAARQPTEHCTSAAEHAAEHTPTGDITSAASKTMNINMIGAAPFNHLVQKSQKDSRFQIFSVTLRDINIALALKKHTDPATKLPSKYHNFLDVFSRKDADTLPKHRPQYDHAIELMKGKVPTWGLYTPCQPMN